MNTRSIKYNPVVSKRTYSLDSVKNFFFVPPGFTLTQIKLKSTAADIINIGYEDGTDELDSDVHLTANSTYTISPGYTYDDGQTIYFSPLSETAVVDIILTR